MFYNDEFYEETDSDMVRAELDSEFGVIVRDKKLFSLKRKRCFKLKLIVKHGEMEKIIIRGPYGFIVKLFEIFNYKPLICDEHIFQNKHGRCYRHIINEEWYNPHYNDNEEQKSESIFDISDELPF